MSSSLNVLVKVDGSSSDDDAAADGDADDDDVIQPNC